MADLEDKSDEELERMLVEAKERQGEAEDVARKLAIETDAIRNEMHRRFYDDIRKDRARGRL